jgi:hypothetical protein
LTQTFAPISLLDVQSKQIDLVKASSGGGRHIVRHLRYLHGAQLSARYGGSSAQWEKINRFLISASERGIWLPWPGAAAIFELRPNCPPHSDVAVTFPPNCRRGLWMRRRGLRGRIMTKLIIDILLFSCMFAFVTGIVIAAAQLL